MLREIRIRDLGVIADATLELSPGLNVVTGETGAGKTMVVSGLGLLLGERADADRVRTGSKSALVEGFVSLDAEAVPELAALAQEYDVEADEDLILSRTVTAAGRSRAHIAGRSVPAALLAEVGQNLVAVHGQADQWRLKRPDEHRDVLDTFAGAELAAALATYREGYRRLKALRAERRALTVKAQERAQRLALLEVGIERIDEVEPTDGEDVELATETERLTHAEDLLAAGTGAAAALSGDEMNPDEPNALALLAAARSQIEAGALLDESLRDFVPRLKEIQTLTADLGADLATYAAGIDMDPERLAQVHARRAAITALMKAYGPELADVIAWRESAGHEARELAGSDDRIVAIDTEIGLLTPQVAAQALAVHELRRIAAGRLGEAVTGELRHLAMGSATLVVDVTQRVADDGLDLGDGRYARPTEYGIDEVTILMSANKGMEPKPIVKAASGGELSRVMLALEVVTATGTVPTFVFDEVDAGVGGEAALDIGARLSRLAEHAQVIVVTHLAQVAAFADNHLVVHKSHDGEVTESGIRAVHGDDRLTELARMLGGVSDSDVAKEHARQLLVSAGRNAASAGAKMK